MKLRIVEPEILDSLPEDHPDALANRNDIRQINHLQGNFRWISRQVQKHGAVNEALLELGAGAGDLGLYLAKKGAIAPDLQSVTGLDLWKRPKHWPAKWQWTREDITQFNAFEDHPSIVANLILHQFEDPILKSLGKQMAKNSRVIIVNEPLRSRMGLAGLHLLRLKGLSYVSVNDGAISIRAGFRKGELPAILNLESNKWMIEEYETLLGSYRMVALRK